jgi:hypothetical protein
MDMRLKQLAAFCALLVMIGCGCLDSDLPTNPPTYVDTVHAAEAGSDGISIYYILADSNGAMTTSDGYVKVVITTWNDILYIGGMNVTTSDFQKAKIGMGVFKHEVILHNLGRIKLDKATSGMVSVMLTFTTPDGEKLIGDTTTYF